VRKYWLARLNGDWEGFTIPDSSALLHNRGNVGMVMTTGTAFSLGIHVSREKATMTQATIQLIRMHPHINLRRLTVTLQPPA
jgi:hypothetical protein